MAPPVIEESFLALLKQHEKLIYKVCYIYCDDAEDRKDLAQEVIAQVWKSFSKYDESFRFSTWLYRIALNVAISHYRRKRRKDSRIVSTGQIVDVSETTDNSDSIEANHQLLYRFIYQLDELNKALMLLYLEENSYKEIATILGITETNVATKISRIKQILKSNFEQFKKTEYGT